MGKKVVIIGAGLAGLSAGCYALMNGYDAEIYEAHHTPGGLCTAWKRQGYTFDGCVHWLTGSNPGSSLYRVWEELGAVQDRPMFDHDIFATFVGSDGRQVHLYADTDRLQDHMLELSPQDAPAIEAFCGQVRRLAGIEMPVGKAPELMGLMDGLRMMAKYAPFLKDLSSLQEMTLGQLGARFTDPLLRRALSNVFYDASMPATVLVSTLGVLSQRGGGFPLGGSLAFAQAIEARYRQLGGKVTYGSRVARVLARGERAVGVQLADGSEVTADDVIAACDMRSTLYTLLDGAHIDPVHSELLDSGKLYPPSVLVSFGVDMDFSDSISCMGTVYELAQPLELAGRQQSVFGMHNFCHDPSLAPPHKSVVQCLIPADWPYWESLREDRPAYERAKQALQGDCLEQMDQIRPGFAAKVEVADVATPDTFVRYTGNWKGSYMTWQLTAEFSRRRRFIPKTVPGLANFHLASMWTNAPGGLPSAALAGREVAQLLCHRDGKRFATETP